MYTYESKFKMGSRVRFVSPSITKRILAGTIKSITFTKARIFYEIMDEDTGKVFPDMLENLIKQEEDEKY